MKKLIAALCLSLALLLPTAAWAANVPIYFRG